MQALISSQGPAARCVRGALSGEIHLVVSAYLLDELRSVASRPKLVARFHLTEEKTEQFIEDVVEVAKLVSEVPHVFDYPRDPKDEPYIDLAIATKARLLVSRDKDLLALNDMRLPEAVELRRLHPAIEILTPSEMALRLG